VNLTFLQFSCPDGRHLYRALLGGIAVLLLLLLGGCGGAPPLTSDQFSKLGFALASIEQKQPNTLASVKAMKAKENDVSWIISLNHGLDNKATRIAVDKNDLITDDQVLTAAELKTGVGLDTAWIDFLRGYLAEDAQCYNLAIFSYREALTDGNSAIATQAHYRLGLLAGNGLILGNETTGWISKTSASPQEVAVNELQLLQRSGKNILNQQPDVQLWVRSPSELAGIGGPAGIGTAPVLPQMLGSRVAPIYITERLDTIYKHGGGKDALYYKLVGAYVNFFKKYFHAYGAAMALIFLALLIKLITAPMTSTSFRGMRDMQRVQPLIKELQEKYKDDKQKLAEAQMALMKEHNVNPMRGCLPLLIQLPIFWVVYRAVQVYAFGFSNAHFIWVHNLAQPDMILLVLYALSMIVTQKLTTAPPTDPQQKAMQTQMTYMMPLMLFFMLSTLASAFVLYWFFLNVFSSIQQYYLIRQYKLEDEARAAAVPATLPKLAKKGKQS
jgi:YidC/Oxa1 family membrane protein insertase